MPEFKTDKAIVLGAKALGENAFVLSLLTQENGRHLGVIKRKIPPEIGDIVSARWSARLPEQLGTFYIESLHTTAAPFLDDIKRLNCLSCLCEVLNNTLPERQSFKKIYEEVFLFLNHLSDENYLIHYIFLEMDLLAALGFGLDLSECAGGGDKNDLAYVSPKTGRAVSREKGLPYHKQLLPLPRFLWQPAIPTQQDLQNALFLTGYFLRQHTVHGILPRNREFLK
ncbi:MAG: DNA repair protein RecO [Alphaproteobacteria bacterium]